MDLNKEQFYSVGNDHLLKVWSSETNQSVQLETFYGHTAKVNTITTIPGDVTRIITSGMDNFIKVCRFSGGRSVYVPLYKNLLIKDRNRRIIAEYNGKNLDELRLKYSMSNSQLKRVLNGK